MNLAYNAAVLVLAVAPYVWICGCPVGVIPRGREAREAAKTGSSPSYSELLREGKAPSFPKFEEQEINIRLGPAKIRLPMMVAKKAVGYTLEIGSIDQEIAYLKEIVRDTPDGPGKCDLYFRLAECYFEKALSIHFIEMQEYDKAMGEWIAKRETDPDAPEPKLCRRKSQVYNDQALAIYDVLLKKCKEYQRKDDVLYTEGYFLYESGRRIVGIRMYWELIKNHPYSPFVPDAYLAIGEHYFNKNDIINARKAYNRTLKFKNSKAYSFALYKMAWCDYNLGEYRKALEKFKQVVELARREAQKTGGDKNKIQLRREALQDMTLAFAQIDALDSAEQYYLSQVGKKGALEYLRKLARIYEKQGKAEMTVKSYRYLLNLYPTAPDCPSFQNSIVQAYRKMNRRDKIEQEIDRLIDLYKPCSTWAEVNRSNKIAIKKANSLVEEALRDQGSRDGVPRKQ